MIKQATLCTFIDEDQLKNIDCRVSSGNVELIAGEHLCYSPQINDLISKETLYTGDGIVEENRIVDFNNNTFLLDNINELTRNVTTDGTRAFFTEISKTLPSNPTASGALTYVDYPSDMRAQIGVYRTETFPTPDDLVNGSIIFNTSTFMNCFTGVVADTVLNTQSSRMSCAAAGGDQHNIQVTDGEVIITANNIAPYTRLLIGSENPIRAFDDDADAFANGLSQGEVYQTTGLGAAPLNVAGIMMIKQ